MLNLLFITYNYFKVFFSKMHQLNVIGILPIFTNLSYLVEHHALYLVDFTSACFNALNIWCILLSNKSVAFTR